MPSPKLAPIRCSSSDGATSSALHGLTIYEMLETAGDSRFKSHSIMLIILQLLLVVVNHQCALNMSVHFCRHFHKCDVLSHPKRALISSGRDHQTISHFNSDADTFSGDIIAHSFAYSISLGLHVLRHRIHFIAAMMHHRPFHSANTHTQQKSSCARMEGQLHVGANKNRQLVST